MLVSRTSPLHLLCLALLALLGLLSLASCSRSEPAQTSDHAAPAKVTKDPAAARALLASGAAVIDVRTADEYAGGHVPNAINIPIQDLPSRLLEVDTLAAGDKARPIVVYCAKGGRASKAKQQLEAAGYTRVVNGGGFDDLR